MATPSDMRELGETIAVSCTLPDARLRGKNQAADLANANFGDPTRITVFPMSSSPVGARTHRARDASALARCFSLST
jgi:hypothetical protein